MKMTKQEVPIRIKVNGPPPGIVTKVQRGKNELLSPTKVAPGAIIFDLMITVDISGPEPNFLGKYAQGPKSGRFIYVNSGLYAGQEGTNSDRRAKISLMSITTDQIAATAAEGSVLFTEYGGTARDGGPTCASVKGIVWKVVAK